MSLLLKDPDAILDYAIDWGAEYLNGDVIDQSSWSVEPIEPGGANVIASAFDFLTATVQTGGGRAGHLYRLTNRVVMASGREDRRSIVLRVERR